MTKSAAAIRSLSAQERSLARWLLENGSEEARSFLAQLDKAEGTTWRCPCGCASYNFKVEGFPEAPPGVHTLGDFVYGHGDDTKGVFIYSANGILSGVELVGYGGDAPSELPDPSVLRRLDQ